MNIVMLAENGREELLYNFCHKYKEILAPHTIITSLQFRDFLKELPLKFTYIELDVKFAKENVYVRLCLQEIDAVIDFYRQYEGFDQETLAIMQECDAQDIPLALSKTMAELLLLKIGGKCSEKIEVKIK